MKLKLTALLILCSVCFSACIDVNVPEDKDAYFQIVTVTNTINQQRSQTAYVIDSKNRIIYARSYHVYTGGLNQAYNDCVQVARTYNQETQLYGKPFKAIKIE